MEGGVGEIVLAVDECLDDRRVGEGYGRYHVHIMSSYHDQKGQHEPVYRKPSDPECHLFGRGMASKKLDAQADRHVGARRVVDSSDPEQAHLSIERMLVAVAAPVATMRPWIYFCKKTWDKAVSLKLAEG